MTPQMPSLVVDIETIGLASSMAAPYPEADRNPPGNYKLPDATEKWRASDKERWAAERSKECSTNPRLGRILCIGGQRTDEAEPGVQYAATEADEARVLERFWEAADGTDGRVVTWNGQWDLRFIIIRSLALGVKPSLPRNIISQWMRKYSLNPHFDCKAALVNHDHSLMMSGAEGLDAWATFFGLPGKAGGMHGGEVWPAFQRGEHQRIADYCAGDVSATGGIYQRIAPMFG